MRTRGNRNVAGKRASRRGAVLIVVLGVVMVAGMMAAHVALVSEVTAREAKVAAERYRLRYAAESAVGRALWFYAVDRRLHPNRRVGLLREEEERLDWEPWMLDGREHRFADLGCRVRLRDAQSGLRVAPPGPEEALRAPLDPENSEMADRVNRFLDVYGDYTDEDDLTRRQGMERADYEALGIPELPRDAPLQFREEVYWMPGWQEVSLGELQIIPPPGAKFRGQSNPPFFSASAASVARTGPFEALELQAVLEARRLWRAQGIPLDRGLAEPALLARVRSRFSFDESGVVEVTAVANSVDGRYRRTVTVTRDAELRRPDAYVGPRREAFSVWDRRVF